MKIINKDDIETYLKIFAGQDEALSGLLRLTLRTPLEKEFSCLVEVKDIDDIPDKRLRKKFNQRVYPWYQFTPTPALHKDVTRICKWIKDFLDQEGHHFNGALKERVKERLRSIKTLQESIQATNTPLLSQKEISKALCDRVIVSEERKGHILHICRLSDLHHLFRIVTTTGMDSAGKRAKNCLWKPNAPDWHMPHRKRVNEQERWQYFSVRDPDNKPVMTLCVDLQRACIQYEPDDIRTQLMPDDKLPVNLQILLNESIRQIKQIQPALNNPRTRIELYNDAPLPSQNIMRYNF